MNSNKTINVATASSCKSRTWQNSTTTVLNFVNSLRQAKVINLSFADFVSLSKAEQFKYKDVGGFVGGVLENGRRKAGSVLSRDFITLDFDNLAAGTIDVVKYKLQMVYGFSSVVYSTAKHSADAPRLRVIIFLNRTITEEEYEPVARYVANMIGIEGADKTTYQAERMMFWPAKCSDAEYVFFDNVQIGSELDVDSMLNSYSDWRNPAEWPRGTTEDCPKPFKLQQVKLSDPREKEGIIGAFCKCYGIHDAIEKFLFDVYAPFEDSDSRYTFVNGSSAGGAIVYDGGMYLYSNHSTDPANTGGCVNAFDLVRLHKFGTLDADVKPDTPNNRLPSFLAMCDLANSDDRVRRQMVVQEFSGPEFERVAQQDKSKLLDLKGQSFNAESFEGLMNIVGILVRFNQISHVVDAVGLPSEYSTEQALNILPTYIYDLAKTVGLKGVTRDAIPAYIAMLADKNRYNPITEVLDSTIWDGSERFNALCEILGVDPNSLYATFVRKWCVSCVALARNDKNRRYSAEGVLTLQGPQGCGKTSFFRALFPPPFDAYFKEGAALDFSSKDSLIQTTAFWCVELGELDSTVDREQPALKAFITNYVDEFRSPYARAAVKHPRHTVFCASVNGERFLRDATGNRRFWVIPVQHIDLAKLRGLDANFFLQLWAQANHLWKQDNNAHRLTPLEMRQLEQLNASHTALLPGEEELLSLFNFDLPAAQWEDFSASELVNRFPQLSKYRSIQIGKALGHIAQTDSRIVKIKRRANVTAYHLPLPSAAVLDFSGGVGAG